MPEKIQCSEASYLLMATSYSEFQCEQRGQVEVKVQKPLENMQTIILLFLGKNRKFY